MHSGYAVAGDTVLSPPAHQPASMYPGTFLAQASTKTRDWQTASVESDSGHFLFVGHTLSITVAHKQEYVNE